MFPRIAPQSRAEAVPATEGGAVTPKAAPADSEGIAAIDYTDFSRVSLKTARILEAERVQGADKLLKLVIEIAGGRRQIVAGVALHYKPEDLVGRMIVVVANLKPAKIRGLVSEGMLLAASAGDQLRLVTVDGDLPTGATVK